MWKVERYSIEDGILGRVSSQGGAIKVQKLFLDGFEFANAADITDWSETPFQSEICDYCGELYCLTEGYLEPRRTENFILWVPARYYAQGTDDRSEGSGVYGPPLAVNDRGFPVFEPTLYEGLCAAIPLCSNDQVPRLTGKDLVAVLFYNAFKGHLTDYVPPIDVVVSKTEIVDEAYVLSLRQMAKVFEEIYEADATVELEECPLEQSYFWERSGPDVCWSRSVAAHRSRSKTQLWYDGWLFTTTC